MNYKFIVEGMTWSYSRLKTYLDCPYAFLLRYILHEEISEGKYFSQYGRFVHELIAGCLSGEIDKRDLPGRFREGYGTAVTCPPPTSAIGDSYYRDALSYMEGFDFPYKDIAAVERKADFTIGARRFVGILDCVAKDGDDYILIDHKSRKLSPRSGREKPLKSDLVLDEYLRQLYLYCVPVKEMFGRYPARLEFNTFRNGTIISEPFDEGKMRDAQKWALDLISEIERRETWEHSSDAFACRNLCDMSTCCEYSGETWE